MTIADPLTAQQARNIQLEAQGLLRRPRPRATRESVLTAIERMQLLQIDTINVVARSPYLVLFSRLGEYRPEWLDETLASGGVFEAWAHEACFVPSRDFALHRAHLDSGARARHWSHKHAARIHDEQRAGMDRLLEHIRVHGAVKASDFERAGPAATSGWWSWKDEKRWLEALFARGELMVARRERFQRVYELSERVTARLLPSTEVGSDVGDVLLQRSVRALGITQARWIADYFRTGRKLKDVDLDAHVARGDLLRLAVRGWEAPAYVHRLDAGLVEAARGGRLRATHSTLLSPFDPLVWDRGRARVMFEFDYTIECYTPAPKRRFGYFVLPILHRGRLVGRLDAKAHRKEDLFEIHSLHLEAAVKPSPELAEAIAGIIQTCADWHRTPDVVISRSEPCAFARLLRSALKR